MNLKYFLYTYFFFVIVQLQAQKDTTLHLIDGSIINVSLIDRNDSAVSIVLMNKDTLEIGLAYLQKRPIKRSFYKSSFYKESSAYLPRKHLYQGIFINANFQTQVFNGNVDGGIGLELNVGKRINRRVNLGLNLQYNESFFYYDPAYFQLRLINIQSYSRLYLSDKNARMFIDGGMGYGMSIDNEINNDWITNSVKGGWSGQVSSGVHLAARKHFRWLFKAGLKVQENSGFDQSRWNGFNTVTTEYSAVHIGGIFCIGVEF